MHGIPAWARRDTIHTNSRPFVLCVCCHSEGLKDPALLESCKYPGHPSKSHALIFLADGRVKTLALSSRNPGTDYPVHDVAKSNRDIQSSRRLRTAPSSSLLTSPTPPNTNESSTGCPMLSPICPEYRRPESSNRAPIFTDGLPRTLCRLPFGKPHRLYQRPFELASESSPAAPRSQTRPSPPFPQVSSRARCQGGPAQSCL